MSAVDDRGGPAVSPRGAADAGPPDADVEVPVEAVPAWLFWGLTLIGVAVIAFGVYGIWTHRGGGLNLPLRPWLTWFIGALLLHDLVIAPLALLLGRGLRFVRPRVLRAPLQVGLALSALVTLLIFPLLRGYGARDVEPSRLPRDYGAGYLTLLALIWVGCAAWAWWRRGRAAAGR